ncbi:unnamed protein product [marine sediment metagenome]|uniref:Uncharacterized protein n=1 Tax=marine sediment metagenome TaxID=412755 RepID=X0YX71_9ZZZZ
MERTWKSTVAGILCITAGTLTLIFCMVVVVFGSTIGAFFGFGVTWEWSTFAIPLIVSASIAIVGGVCALRRRFWGLALAGSICALIGPWGTLGILAIVFVSLGKVEFE